MSGIAFKLEHLLNKPIREVILIISHLEISRNVFNDEHPENKQFISLVFSIFHFDISGKLINFYIHLFE